VAQEDRLDQVDLLEVQVLVEPVDRPHLQEALVAAVRLAQLDLLDQVDLLEVQVLVEPVGRLDHLDQVDLQDQAYLFLEQQTIL